ncbi:MAG TPA: transglycosylase SLT domain-containing protein [Acidimicrobiia bacterium]|nr:transglycosylase SLT domain-containing protein [Acidimicrobiia bacterium]
MDGIAAIEARVAEIQARFAPPPLPATEATGDAFAAHLRRAMGTGSAPPSAGAGRAPGNVDAWIGEAIARTGVPASWAPALRTIAHHESSFNPSAANLTAAGGNLAKAPQGLMQMLPSTFAAHAQPGHGNILDPVDNLMAAIDYIRRRYGDPSSTPGLKALARGERYRGY